MSSIEPQPCGSCMPAMHVDILIIGAGPAGCAAAISARQAGLRVMLIEARANTCRAPGETLHPGIEPILKKLGVWHDIAAADFYRHRGVWRETDGVRIFAPYGSDNDGEWLGFQADRRTLHGILQRAAGEAGAIFKPAAIPSRLIWQDGRRGRIAGVICNGSEIRARWVFDATGRRAWLARMLELQADCPGPPLRVRFGWKNGSDQCLQGQPLFQQHIDGWEWQAPLGDGRTAWAILEHPLERTTRERSHPIAASRAGEWDSKGVDMTWRLHEPCGGPGYFLLGDAAALLDPASSNGVLRALMSGMLAADLAARMFRGGDENSAAQAYIHWISELFYHQTSSLLESYPTSPRKRHSA